MTIDSREAEWKAVMNAGADEIARRERMRRIERRLAVASAVWTIRQECKFIMRLDGNEWWSLQTFFDDATRERVSDCVEYFD
ncbi:MAG: hypothetical protein IPM06_17880 [Rhizobiales bacterium]|nr:hypothetical protein [Hyphomicrobiales bacterium]